MGAVDRFLLWFDVISLCVVGFSAVDAFRRYQESGDRDAEFAGLLMAGIFVLSLYGKCKCQILLKIQEREKASADGSLSDG